METLIVETRRLDELLPYYRRFSHIIFPSGQRMREKRHLPHS
jgi:hypothetical protein